jgi:hypothetical protein
MEFMQARLKIGDSVSFWDPTRKVIRTQIILKRAKTKTLTWYLAADNGTPGFRVQEETWTVIGCGPILAINDIHDNSLIDGDRKGLEERVRTQAKHCAQQLRRIQGEICGHNNRVLLRMEKVLARIYGKLDST